MRISDWSSDVCSSDLGADRTAQVGYPPRGTRGEGVGTDRPAGHGQEQPRAAAGGRDGNGPRRPDRIRGRAQGTRRRLEQRRRHERTAAPAARHRPAFQDRPEGPARRAGPAVRSEEQTSEIQSLISKPYSVFLLNKKKKTN